MRKSSGSGFFSLSLACFFLTLHSSTKSSKTNLANVLTFPKTKKSHLDKEGALNHPGVRLPPPLPPTCNALLNRPLFTWAWNQYKIVISGFRVCFFNNYIEKNQNNTQFEECASSHTSLRDGSSYQIGWKDSKRQLTPTPYPLEWSPSLEIMCRACISYYLALVPPCIYSTDTKCLRGPGQFGHHSGTT